MSEIPERGQYQVPSAAPLPERPQRAPGGPVRSPSGASIHRRLCLNTPDLAMQAPDHIHQCKHDHQPDHDAPGVLHECRDCPATWMRTGPRPAPDLSWVTTEPAYQPPKWLSVTGLVAKLGLLLMLAAIASAVILK